MNALFSVEQNAAKIYTICTFITKEVARILIFLARLAATIAVKHCISAVYKIQTKKFLA